MPTIYFATSNKEKLLIARTVAGSAGFNIQQVNIDIDEIQGEDADRIVKDKARRAYEQFGKPAIVSDDTWDIPALKGFPGAYMKSVNHWFTPQDFLRLMHGIKDRTVVLHQYLAYHDGQNITVFSNDIHGQILHEARGHNDKNPNTPVITLDGDNGKTIAEVYAQGQVAIAERYKNRPDVWHGFIEWYKHNQ